MAEDYTRDKGWSEKFRPRGTIALPCRALRNIADTNLNREILPLRIVETVEPEAKGTLLMMQPASSQV
jgi:hypothetical protein